MGQESSAGSGALFDRAMAVRVSSAALLVATIILASLPRFSTSYTQNVVIQLFMYLALASSWNIISGFTGYMSLGHVSFFGLGAYAYAILVGTPALAWPLAVLAGGGLATVVAGAVGWACLRLRGYYFSIATLGLNEALRITVLGWDTVTGGGRGIFLSPVTDLVSSYFAMGLVAASAITVSSVVARSRFGLHLLSIREDEVAAGMLGINTTAKKFGAFALSAVFPGMVGALYARFIGFIDPPSTFSVLITLQMAVFTLFGGRGTVSGPIVGTCLLFALQEVVWARFPYLHLFVFGLLLVLVVIVIPNGVVGMLEDRGVLSRGVVRL